MRQVDMVGEDEEDEENDEGHRRVNILAWESKSTGRWAGALYIFSRRYEMMKA